MRLMRFRGCGIHVQSAITRVWQLITRSQYDDTGGLPLDSPSRPSIQLEPLSLSDVLAFYDALIADVLVQMEEGVA